WDRSAACPVAAAANPADEPSKMLVTSFILHSHQDVRDASIESLQQKCILHALRELIFSSVPNPKREHTIELCKYSYCRTP
ncbi:hypothetical protein, partial [Methylorubrum podarium]|uniref:hypothetical protein n=1 Tax=Methylorubrum podarium TaxID=200476 RepID=UPI001EE2395E